MPVGEHPAFDGDAVNQVVVARRAVRMAMYKGGISVLAQEIIRVACVEVHEIGGALCLLSFGDFALLAKRSSNRLAFDEWFCQKSVTPEWISHLGTETLVLSVVRAQSVTVREDELPGWQRKDVRVTDQSRSALFGKALTEQEIAVAMLDQHFVAGVDVRAQGLSHAKVEVVACVVKAVVSRPCLEKIAENTELAGGACRAGQISEEALRRRRRLRRKVQVRNEMDQDRSGRLRRGLISRFRRVR